jgi:predicted alpha/beta hydrolase family esterase
MKQVLIIHGGTSFNSYESYIEELKNSAIDYDHMKPSTDWRSWLADELPEVDVLTPTFPNKHNAVFNEWKITFEKIIPFLNRETSIIGYSLGATFLAKYLHETSLPTPIHQLILISGVYDDDTNEELGSFKITSAKGLEKSTDNIYLIHSKDDPIVPFKELSKFQNDLEHAHTYSFTDRGHFRQSTFPELLQLLKQK